MMTNLPLVTVGLSVFNMEDCVEEAIQSVLQQSYPNWEMIVIDDASSDGTFEILKRYEGPNIRLFRNEFNRGTYWNRNRAILRARGQFFTTIDGDDLYHPDKIRRQVEQIGDEDACISYYIRRHPRYPGGQRVHMGYTTLLFRRSITDEVGYYDTVRFAADTEYIERFSLNRRRVEIPEPLLEYRVRAGSLTEIESSSVVDGTSGAQIRSQYRHNCHTWYAQSEQPPYLSFPVIRRSVEAGGPGHAVERDPITVSLFSASGRDSDLQRTVETILRWADHIDIFLSDDKTAPHWLTHPKIETHLSHTHFGEQGYHFICSDRRTYPETYAELLLRKLEQYDYDAIIGLQRSSSVFGAEAMSTPLDRYGNDPKDAVVAGLDSHAIAYHTSKIRLSLDRFTDSAADDADLYWSDAALSRYAQRENIPLIHTAYKV